MEALWAVSFHTGCLKTVEGKMQTSAWEPCQQSQSIIANACRKKDIEYEKRQIYLLRQDNVMVF